MQKRDFHRPSGVAVLSKRERQELKTMEAELMARDPRWETVLLPLADGLTMLRKR